MFCTLHQINVIYEQLLYHNCPFYVIPWIVFVFSPCVFIFNGEKHKDKLMSKELSMK